MKPIPIFKFSAKFKIHAKVGEGGMGEVYRATDTKLGREVAIKVLPRELYLDLDSLERFKREAEALASLNHPNIATLYGIEESGDSKALILELVEGETLTQRLRSGPLTVTEVLSTFKQIAEALDMAHQKGIIHRDLKLANIMLTSEARVKVLDFGLAKAIELPGKCLDEMAKGEETAVTVVDSMTQAGVIVGTPAYMSPEQARGDSVDRQTDIWSFGCCLYECLTGNKPFKGRSLSETIAEILKSEPDYSLIPDEFPRELVSLVKRCLEKEQRRRLKDIGDIAIRFEESLEYSKWNSMIRDKTQAAATERKWSLREGNVKRILFGTMLIVGICIGLLASHLVGKNTPDDKLGDIQAFDIRKIAVLPFNSISSDPSQEWLVDGMTEILIETLGSEDSFQITSSTSSRQFKNTDKTLPDIVELLGADAILEGSVMLQDNRVHISARLIDGRTDQQLWGDYFDGNLENFFELQKKVSNAIRECIKGVAEGGEDLSTGEEPSVAVAALEDYLNGKILSLEYEPAKMLEALKRYDLAIEKDPEFASAYANKALVLTHLAYWGMMKPDAAWEQARLLTERSLEMAPDSAESHLANAHVATYFDWDWESAETAHKDAIRINPSFADAYIYYGELLSVLGRHKEAIEMGQKAVDLSPLSGMAINKLGWSHFHSGDFNGALALAEKNITMQPDSFLPFHLAGYAHAALGEDEKAGSLVQQAFEKAGEAPYYMARLGYILGILGKRDQTEELLLRLEKAAQDQPETVKSFHFGLLNLALGNDKEAVRWFDASIDERNADVIFLGNSFRYDSQRKALREQPAYKHIFEKVGLPE